MLITVVISFSSRTYERVSHTPTRLIISLLTSCSFLLSLTGTMIFLMPRYGWALI
jgi:hypothetical protein